MHPKYLGFVFEYSLKNLFISADVSGIFPADVTAFKKFMQSAGMSSAGLLLFLKNDNTASFFSSIVDGE